MFYIYRITNNVNGKTYVGQRKCPKNKTPMEDTYMGSGKLIKQAIKKYGVENFTKTILCKFLTREMTNFAELYYIKKEMQQKGKDCYNLLVGAHWNKDHEPWNKGKPAWNKGKSTSDEVKAKISVAHKGKKLSEEWKAKISASEKGRKISDEHKAKISASNKGKHSSMKGRHLSEETKAKISAARKGKKGVPRSEETRKKISAARKAYWSRKRGEQA